jgi:hypothetical protein
MQAVLVDLAPARPIPIVLVVVALALAANLLQVALAATHPVQHKELLALAMAMLNNILEYQQCHMVMAGSVVVLLATVVLEQVMAAGVAGVAVNLELPVLVVAVLAHQVLFLCCIHKDWPCQILPFLRR